MNTRIYNDSKGSSTRRSSIFDVSSNMKLFSTLTLDGRKILDEILSTPEFEVEVYTPKHSCTKNYTI